MLQQTLEETNAPCSPGELVQFSWTTWRVSFFECLLQHNFSPRQSGVQPTCQTVSSTEYVAISARQMWRWPRFFKKPKMHLGPLNALLTALESDESMHRSGDLFR